VVRRLRCSIPLSVMAWQDSEQGAPQSPLASDSEGYGKEESDSAVCGKKESDYAMWK